MCISSIMTRSDLFALECGSKFYLENEEGKTLEGIKIAQHEFTRYRIIVADFPEIGENGEAIVMFHEWFTVEGELVGLPDDFPPEWHEFGSNLRLCMEGNDD